MLVGLLAGCASSLSNTPDEELPLKPVTGSDGQPTACQQASIELTNRDVNCWKRGAWRNPPLFFQKSISLFPFQSLSLLLPCQGALHAAGIPEGASLLGQAERFFGGDPIWLSRVYVLARNDLRGAFPVLMKR
jgi:hypothetical protein